MQIDVWFPDVLCLKYHKMYTNAYVFWGAAEDSILNIAIQVEYV